MTSTSFNVGLNTASRNSSKVLKPPGGGSSDIFGASEPVEPQRKVKTHLTSSIFAEEPAAPARNKAGNSSFYNLFGSEAHIKPLTDSSNISRSTVNPDESIKKTEESLSTEDDLKKMSSTDQATAENGDLEETTVDANSSGCNEEPPAPVESPAVMNGTASSTNSTVSSTAPTPTNAPAAGRSRIPPGGFSSGLW